MLLNILQGALILDGIAMIGVILLQRSEGGGFVSGGGGQLISARGAGNLLTKSTQVLALIFFVLSILITILTGRDAASSSVSRMVKDKGLDASSLKTPAAPIAPPAGIIPEAPPAVPGLPGQ